MYLEKLKDTHKKKKPIGFTDAELEDSSDDDDDDDDDDGDDESTNF